MCRATWKPVIIIRSKHLSRLLITRQHFPGAEVLGVSVGGCGSGRGVGVMGEGQVGGREGRWEGRGCEKVDGGGVRARGRWRGERGDRGVLTH